MKAKTWFQIKEIWYKWIHFWFCKFRVWNSKSWFLFDLVSFFFPFEIRGWRPRICKITRTIYSNSESSEPFLVTECFFWLVPGGFSYLINQNNSNSNWKKILGFRNMQEKLIIYQLYRPTFKKMVSFNSAYFWFSAYFKAQKQKKLWYVKIWTRTIMHMYIDD